MHFMRNLSLLSQHSGRSYSTLCGGWTLVKLIRTDLFNYSYLKKTEIGNLHNKKTKNETGGGGDIIRILKINVKQPDKYQLN